MIIASAPVRISFAGGGTDLPAYYRPFGGQVVSTAIDRYVYVMVRQSGARDSVHIISSDAGYYSQGYRDAPAALPSPLPCAVLDHFGITGGIEIFITSQVPSGTGLGSSSALAVALIHALGACAGQYLSPLAAAELACEIELERLGSPIGKQDQYASALGGLNEITFAADSVSARPLRLAPDTRENLQQRLLLFFTGTRRAANTILDEQRQASEERRPQTMESLHALKWLAGQTTEVLEAGDLDGFGALLHEAWERKKSVTAGVSNAFIDECYTVAREAGATGGKITGAGGGGFLLLYCLPAYQGAVTDALCALGLQPFAFGFAREPAGLCAAWTPSAAEAALPLHNGHRLTGVPPVVQGL